MKMNSLVDKALHPGAVPRLAGRGATSTSTSAGSAACARASPACRRTIRVVSIVGRFLEHSRIYAFERGDEQAIYIGSADLMPRNLDTRVELLAPCAPPALRAELMETMELCLADDANAWVLGEDGDWTRRGRPATEPRDVQRELMAKHAARAAEAAAATAGLTRAGLARPTAALGSAALAGTARAAAPGGRGTRGPGREVALRCVARSGASRPRCSPGARWRPPRRRRPRTRGAAGRAARARALPGDVDGLRGPATTARRAALPGAPGPRWWTGSPGRQTRRRLGWRGRPRARARACSRRRSAAGTSPALQFLLGRQGFPSGPVDGDLGPRTDAALRRFQAWAGLGGRRARRARRRWRACGARRPPPAALRSRRSPRRSATASARAATPSTRRRLPGASARRARGAGRGCVSSPA